MQSAARGDFIASLGRIKVKWLALHYRSFPFLCFACLHDLNMVEVAPTFTRCRPFLLLRRDFPPPSLLPFLTLHNFTIMICKSTTFFLLQPAPQLSTHTDINFQDQLSSISFPPSPQPPRLHSTPLLQIQWWTVDGQYMPKGSSCVDRGCKRCGSS
jgi:hypothetical protein